MSKCVWLMCKTNHPVQAEYSCSEHFGTLASLNETSVARISEYFNHVKARSLGITQVSYPFHLLVFLINPSTRAAQNRHGHVLAACIEAYILRFSYIMYVCCLLQASNKR